MKVYLVSQMRSQSLNVMSSEETTYKTTQMIKRWIEFAKKEKGQDSAHLKTESSNRESYFSKAYLLSETKIINA